jgi:hypothetical protein
MAREVSIVVSAKNKIAAGLGEAQASLAKFGDGVKKMGAGIVSVFKKVAVGVGAVGGTLATLGGIAVKAASDAAEMQSKFDTVFRGFTADAEQFAENLGSATNRSKTEIKGMMASLQDLFVPMGMARGEAADYSKKMTQLAIDVASFNNASDQKVIEDFASAMTGSNEVMKKYGVVMTENSIKQKAVEMGLAKTTKEVSEVAKAQARYQIILEGTTDAHGDAEKTAGSMANQMKGLKAAVSEATIAIGAQIMDSAPLADIVGKISGKVKDLTQKFESWAESGGIAKTIRDIKVWAAETKAKFAEVGAVVGSFGEWLGSNISAMFQNLVDVAREKLHKAKAVVENWSYNIGLEISAALDPNISRKDIQDLYRTWDHGFDEIKSATINNLRGIEDYYKVTGEQLVDIQKEKNASIKAAEDDLQKALDEKAKKAAERNKKESDAAEQQLEETENQLESTKSTVEELTNALEVQKRHYEVIYDAVDKTSQKVNEFNKESSGFDVKKFVSNLEKLAKGLSQIDATDIDLAWLDDIRKIDVGNLSGTKAAKFVNNVKRIAEGLGDIPFIDLPDLSSLKDLEIPKLDAREVDMLIRQILKMDKELRFVNLPDLSLQLNMDIAQADAIKNMAVALKGINGMKAELAFKENITKAIVQNEKNTRSIAKTIKDAGGFA